MGWFASPVASAHEILYPSLSIGVRARSRGDQHAVALVRQGLDVLLPERGSVLRGHVGLTLLVGLVESHHYISVAFLDKFGKIGDLIVAP